MAGGAKGTHCSSSRAAEQAADSDVNEQWLIESKERGRRRTRSDWNASTRKYAALQQRWDAQMREAAREEEFQCMTMMQPGDALPSPSTISSSTMCKHIAVHSQLSQAVGSFASHARPFPALRCFCCHYTCLLLPFVFTLY